MCVKIIEGVMCVKIPPQFIQEDFHFVHTDVPAAVCVHAVKCGLEYLFLDLVFERCCTITKQSVELSLQFLRNFRAQCQRQSAERHILSNSFNDDCRKLLFRL